jgi:hypothetical protein
MWAFRDAQVGGRSRSGPLTGTSWTWTYDLGPGLPVTGPGPKLSGSGLVQTQVCKDQDRTSDSLLVVIIRGNPGVKSLNPYPTLHKPLPLVKGKGFEGSGSGFWRVEGYKGSLKGLC